MQSCQNSNYKKILNRKFVISRDLTKYTKDLRYLGINQKYKMFTRTVRGNLVAQRKKALQKQEQANEWAKKREALKLVDWEDSDLYDAFVESRELRKPIESVLQRYASLKTAAADKMYTDVELQYFIQLIQKKDCMVDSDEVKQENRT